METMGGFAAAMVAVILCAVAVILVPFAVCVVWTVIEEIAEKYQSYKRRNG